MAALTRSALVGVLVVLFVSGCFSSSGDDISIDSASYSIRPNDDDNIDRDEYIADGWSVEIVDRGTKGGSVGLYPSIDIDGEDHLHVSYYVEWRYARKD
ncbi:MAG TPA: hypothetical protein ENF73_02975, partial [Proteobacteria bacterium]|nr:hypothetical protein [Pseudomonadota bacterium]